MKRQRNEFPTSALFALCLLLAGAPALAQTPPIAAGTPLGEALRQLQDSGLKLVFSSQLVPSDLRVKKDVRGQPPREVLRELLAPHRLDVTEGPDGVLVVVRKAAEKSETGFPGRTADRIVMAEEIVVQPSRLSLLIDEPASQMGLSRADIEALPDPVDDVFQTLTRLPGTTSNDLSAELHLRGGRPDEVLILLDGQELYEPFHLQDLDNALSIVGTSALSRVNLITAAFPVSYGDRMSGVLNMVTAEPPSRSRVRLSASMMGAQLEAGETYEGGIGWTTSLRRGNTALLGRAFDLQQAVFWDFFGKVDLPLTSSQFLRMDALASTDSLDTTEEETVQPPPGEEQKQLKTRYDSFYLWLTHRSVLSENLFVDTIGSRTHVARHRRGIERDDERGFTVRDQREMDVTGLVQSWNLQRGTRHLLNAGLEYRRFDANYDYSSAWEFSDSIAAIGGVPEEGSFVLSSPFGSEHVSFYLSDRIRLMKALNLEVGIRYDRQNGVDSNVMSPRINAAWALGPRSALRLGWGHFAQSHRAYEVMVEDGDAVLYPGERSQHLVLGFEHFFAPAFALPLSNVRVEAYRRGVSNPRPRYENLLQPYDPFPEGDFDRVRIESEYATAQGAELLLRGRATERIGWWLNYAYASTTDRVEDREVPRGIDQTHAVNVDVNYRIGAHWNMNLAAVYRSGRPTTPLTTPGELGERNSQRLPNYHRLDLRVARDWQTRTGTLGFFVDVFNVFDHDNVSGMDVSVDEERGTLLLEPGHFPGFFATAGISIEFR